MVGFLSNLTFKNPWVFVQDSKIFLNWMVIQWWWWKGLTWWNFTKEEPVATSFASAPSRPAASLVQYLGFGFGCSRPNNLQLLTGQHNCLVVKLPQLGVELNYRSYFQLGALDLRHPPIYAAFWNSCLGIFLAFPWVWFLDFEPKLLYLCLLIVSSWQGWLNVLVNECDKAWLFARFLFEKINEVEDEYAVEKMVGAWMLSSWIHVC